MPAPRNASEDGQARWSRFFPGGRYGSDPSYRAGQPWVRWLAHATVARTHLREGSTTLTTTYLSRTVLDAAQSEIEHHLKSGGDGRCLACGEFEPCEARSSASQTFARCGSLPRRVPGLACPNKLVPQDAFDLADKPCKPETAEASDATEDNG